LHQYQFLDFRHDEEAALSRLVELLKRSTEPAPAGLPLPKVFLCHAKEDAQRVEGLYFSLRDRGLDPWYDKEKLLVGDDWEREILTAIEQSDFFAVFLSNTSSKKTGFIQKEIKTAVREYQRRPEGFAYLLPIKLEECEIPDIKLDDNKRLENLHWAELFEDDYKAIDRLAKAILTQWRRKLQRQE